MPVFTPEYLHEVAYHIYRAKGTPDDEAEIVARHLIKANLSGNFHTIFRRIKNCL